MQNSKTVTLIKFCFRYVIAENRVLIHIQDGSNAYDIKDFLVKQKTCAKVEFENQEFPGAGALAGKTEL